MGVEGGLLGVEDSLLTHVGQEAGEKAETITFSIENSPQGFVSKTPRSEINHTGQPEETKPDSISSVLGSSCSKQ